MLIQCHARRTTASRPPATASALIGHGRRPTGRSRHPRLLGHPPPSLTPPPPPPAPAPQVWSGKDFSLAKTLAGHEGKIMCVDVAPDHTIASASYDRTIKLWAPEAAAGVLGGGRVDRMEL